MGNQSSDSQSAEAAAANDAAVVFGGKTISVTKLDGSSLSVQVKQLVIADFPKYMQLLEKENECAVLLSDLSIKEVKQLTPESVLDICEAGEEINFETARRWGSRRARSAEMFLEMMPESVRSQLPKSVPK